MKTRLETYSNWIKALFFLALMVVALRPLEIFAAKATWINYCRLANNIDDTTKRLTPQSPFTVFVCSFKPDIPTPTQLASMVIPMDDEDDKQLHLFITTVPPENSQAIVALANPETHSFAQVENNLGQQIDRQLIINAVDNFQHQQSALLDRIHQDSEHSPLLTASGACGTPWPIDTVPYPYSPHRDIDNDIIDDLEELTKKSRSRNLPPKLNPKITSYCPKFQVIANHLPQLIKFWDSFKGYFFWVIPIVSGLSFIYDQSVRNSVVEFEPTTEPEFSGCLMKMSVNLNELLLDMYNGHILKEKVTSRNTVREIANAFALPQGEGVNFTTTGQYIQTEDSANRCYCSCQGEREAGNFGGCYVDFTLQSDVFERDLLDLTNSNYDTTLVSLETLRNSELANSTLVTLVIIQGYFNGFDTPLNSENEATCSCPACPQKQTKSSERLGNFLSNLSTYSIALAGATLLIVIVKGAPCIYKWLIK